ncbi:MAG TPA: phosphoribosylformylglycinamidine cyclo-ligase [Clostridia bacterium]|nr:phosphoribosylformylglycinamidine cyclo-ligase [Clostridia bacterium]
MSERTKAISYREAGVDIDAGNRTVELIKEHARTATRPEVLSGIGGFGGLFALDPSRYREPVLVASTDGVGTKLQLAFDLDEHHTVGIDLVAMCVNDILVQGAEPLFFLDYLATGRLVPEQAAAVVKGIAEGCRQAGCALIGGETAEMPGFYPPDHYDLAGFAVGVVEREKIIDGSRVTAGDKLIGLASSGLHSNGFSLARKVLFDRERARPGAAGDPAALKKELLTPTRIYVPYVLPLLEKYQVKGMAHITGGGLVENLPRAFPVQFDALVQVGSWPVPPVFELIARQGPVAPSEMYRTFNMGIGFVLIVDPREETAVKEELASQGLPAYTIGSIIPGSGVTRFDPPLA